MVDFLAVHLVGLGQLIQASPNALEKAAAVFAYIRCFVRGVEAEVQALKGQGADAAETGALGVEEVGCWHGWCGCRVERLKSCPSFALLGFGG